MDKSLFIKAVEAVVKLEGGYVASSDRNTEEKFGLTRATIEKLRIYGNFSSFTFDDAVTLYCTEYYFNVGLYRLDNVPELLICVFAAGINVGPQKAIMLLQGAISKHVECVSDGIFGPKTEAALKEACNMLRVNLAAQFNFSLSQYYRRIAVGEKEIYLKGWLNRVTRVQQIASQYAKDMGAK